MHGVLLAMARAGFAVALCALGFSHHVMGEAMADRLEQLEQVKQAAIGFLEQEQPMNWAVHRDELQRGAVMFVAGAYRIGRWTFDFQTMNLLREADVAPEVRRYGMKLEPADDQGFRVTGDFWEQERWDFADP